MNSPVPPLWQDNDRPSRHPAQLQCCSHGPTWQPLDKKGPQLHNCVYGRDVSQQRSTSSAPSLDPFSICMWISVCFLPSSQPLFLFVSPQTVGTIWQQTWEFTTPWGLSLAMNWLVHRCKYPSSLAPVGSALRLILSSELAFETFLDVVPLLGLLPFLVPLPHSLISFPRNQP